MFHSPQRIAISVAILFQVLAVLLGLAPVLGADHQLAGPDGYMRLLQAERLWAEGGWFDRFSPLTNAPFGETLHWTRPFDLLLLAGAWPLAWFADARQALYLAGYFVGPVLQLAAVAFLMRGIAPALGGWVAAVAGILFCLMPVLRGVFMTAQPDHHSLQMVLFVALYGLINRMAVEGPAPRPALAAGIVAGMALWVSVEGLIATIAALAVWGAFRLSRGAEWDEAIRRFLWGLAIMTLAAFLLDRPPAEWLRPEYDRLSIVHLVLAAGMVAGWEIARRLPLSRWTSPAVAAAVPAMIMLLAFPRFFGGPFVDVDPRLPAEWSDWIGEARPLWPGSLETGARLVFDLGPLAAALPALAWGLRHAAGDGEKAFAILHLVLLAVLVPLGLSQERLAAYPEAALAAPWALALAMLARLSRLPALGRGLAVAVALAGHLFVAAHLYGKAEEAGALTPPRRSCPWADVAPTIRDLAAREGRRLTVLGYVHQGPEIVYRTGQAVVGSPFQRNHAGILDTHTVLRSTDMAEVRRVVDGRKVDLVAVCRRGSEAERYRGRGDNLYRLALEGGEPPWLARVPLPAEAAEEFALLAVRRND